MSLNVNSRGVKPRSSNLELYRVIVMLLIVAHHYVVYSGRFQGMNENGLTPNSIFVYLFGMWGKTGINCFVLITGYFMCKSEATVRKFLKLLFEIIFYEVVVYVVFAATGNVEFEMKDFLKALIPLSAVGREFTTAFILFYLFIPFLNGLVRNMDRKKHLLLIVLCLCVYTVWGMSPFGVVYNYISWFCVLYFIASFIRLYPQKHDTDVVFWRNATILSVLLSYLAVVSCLYLGKFVYFFVHDSHAVMAVVTSVCSFMYFKNIRIKQSKFVNMLGASTFGVLLIHENSVAMRQLIWKDILNNEGYWDSPYLWIHAVGSVILVFIVCVSLDRLRINLVEKPFFNSRVYQGLESCILNMLNRVGA